MVVYILWYQLPQTYFWRCLLWAIYMSVLSFKSGESHYISCSISALPAAKKFCLPGQSYVWPWYDLNFGVGIKYEVSAVCQGMLIHSCLSSLNHCWLILGLNSSIGSPLKKKRCRWVMVCSTFPNNSHMWDKSQHHTRSWILLFFFLQHLQWP